jgi:8-oxo-dGTP diphosphatase
MKSVTAAILVKNEKILIAKRRSTDKLGNKWEFPGGKIESGETPEKCLKREMMEEFEIEVSIGQYLGESIYRYEHGSIRLLAYRAYWERGDISTNAHDDFKWVSLDQLEKYDFLPADLPFVEKLKSGEIRP